MYDINRVNPSIGAAKEMSAGFPNNCQLEATTQVEINLKNKLNST